MDGEIISADKVIIAMGPWSGEAAKWVPSAPMISGQKAHSILVRPTEPVGPDCLFTQFQSSSGALRPAGAMLMICPRVISDLADDEDGQVEKLVARNSFMYFYYALHYIILQTAPAGRHTDPEVYPRPDGMVILCESIVWYLQDHTGCKEHMRMSCEVLLEMPADSSPECEQYFHLQVYICGESDSVGLPDDPMSIQPRASAMKSLQARQLLFPIFRRLPTLHSHLSALRIYAYILN